MPSPDYIKLSELNRRIQSAIKAAFGKLNCWVIADVTNHSYRSAKNYHYFELVEKDRLSNDIIAKISGSAWGAASARIAVFERQTGQSFTSNINVLVNVTVDYHPVYGLRVTLNDIDATFTLGLLEQEKQATLEKLVAENPGYIEKLGERFLTANSRLTMNRVIQHIALITAPGSAGAEDFMHTLQHNAHGYQFFIDEYLTGMQGEGNAGQLVAQLVAVFTAAKQYDAVVITRGGGSQSDFLIFDNYLIGKAIAKFPVPVITGIGHQKNETIADLMAHTPLKTPTKVAEYIIAHNRRFEEALLSFEQSIVIRSQQFISEHKGILVQLNQAIVHQAKQRLFDAEQDLTQLLSMFVTLPKITMRNQAGHIKKLVERILVASSHYLKSQQARLAHHQSIVRMMSPGNIQKMGFAIIKLHGKIISNTTQLEAGATIDIIVNNQALTATVNNKKEYNGNDPDL